MKESSKRFLALFFWEFSKDSPKKFLKESQGAGSTHERVFIQITKGITGRLSGETVGGISERFLVRTSKCTPVFFFLKESLDEVLKKSLKYFLKEYMEKFLKNLLNDYLNESLRKY